MNDISTIVRQVGKNFVLPLFYDQAAASIVNKIPGASPVGAADVGAQILIAREIKKRFPDDCFFGEETIPSFFGPKIGHGQAVEHFDISRPLDLSCKNDTAFVELARDILVAHKPAKSGNRLDDFKPAKETAWIVDPVDGTSSFKKGLPYFCVQLARVQQGRIVGAWVYRPVQDQLFRATANVDPQIVTFDKKDRPIAAPLTLPPVKPLEEMRVAYAPAKPYVPLDDVAKAIYTKEDGSCLSFEELAARFSKDVQNVTPAVAYAFSVTDMFLQNVDAVCMPGTLAWDHFATAYIARRAGYQVAFLNREAYLGSNYTVPLTENGTIKQKGGILYTHPKVWPNLDWTMNRGPCQERLKALSSTLG
ncbi:MAG: hypothetical protein PHS57_04705 [Alphaproteobacteria bacterium]|nr:hypothetical protein [Alphaproteobacteria bacterium]